VTVVLVLPEAESDVRAGAAWYELRRSGLGEDLVVYSSRAWTACTRILACTRSGPTALGTGGRRSAGSPTSCSSRSTTGSSRWSPSLTRGASPASGSAAADPHRPNSGSCSTSSPGATGQPSPRHAAHG